MVLTALATDMMGSLQLPAIGALGDIDPLECVVGTAHIAAGFGRFLFRDGHDGFLSCRFQGSFRQRTIPGPLAKACLL